MSELNIKLGILLKTERERQKIKIEDLSERLKISVPYLQAIEAGTSDGLPSDLYFSLFAKSYAEALGIDYSRTVDAIKLDLEEINNNVDKPKEDCKNPSNSNDNDAETENQFLKKGGIVLAVIVGLFILFLGVNKFFLNSGSTDSSSENENDPQAQEQFKVSKELDEAYNNFDWDNNEYVKSSKIILTLTPRKESWSAVFADGDTAIYRTLRVGRTYTAEADYRLIVSVGVPSAVTIKLNGQEVDLRNKDSRRIYKVKIDQMNIDNFLKPKDESTAIELPDKEITLEVMPSQPVAINNDSVTDKNNKSN